jgi:hypothetical protein
MSAPEAKYLIQKHGGYYRPNSAGYTTSWHEAGRYTEAEAIAESHPNGPDGPRDGMTYVHEDEVRPSVYKDLRDYTAADLEAAVKRALEWAVDACANYPRCSPEYSEYIHYDDQITHSQNCIRAASPDTIAKLARGE